MDRIVGVLEEARTRFKDQGVAAGGCAVRMAMASSGYVVGPFCFIGLDQSLIFVLGKGRQAGQSDPLRGRQCYFRRYGLLYQICRSIGCASEANPYYDNDDINVQTARQRRESRVIPTPSLQQKFNRTPVCDFPLPRR